MCSSTTTLHIPKQIGKNGVHTTIPNEIGNMGSIHNNTTQFLMKQAKYTTPPHIPMK